MIETLTMFTLGFAIASLLPMVVVPCVHGRAERLFGSKRQAGIDCGSKRTSRAPTSPPAVQEAMAVRRFSTEA
jgi:hypothetical protein